MVAASENKYCVIGRSLPHTLSPRVHALFGREDYGVRELEDTLALERFVKSRECVGYNVTIPYKQEIIPMLDALSKEAEQIGAVNTVVTEGDRLVGYNTDVAGMEYAINAAGISLEGKNVLILGSGGTCQTAKYLCVKNNAASVNVVSRKGECNYSNCYELCDTQVIINTTPVGMSPHAYETPIDLSRFVRLESVFDCIYNPLQTLLVNSALKLGLKAANGLLMLVEQARVAHNLYQAALGLPTVGEEATKRAAAEIRRDRENILLIGMAGCGKSTIGRLVAERLKREFIDTDCEIERAEGKSIPEIFESSGEKYFREVERREVERACLRQGVVIATGGGAVIDEKNRFFIGANGLCVFIDREVGRLATVGRPLSKDRNTVAELLKRRYPIYLDAADVTVSNNSDIQTAVDAVIAAYKKAFSE